MSKPPDLEALARRYVELWQDQVAATAVDPELTDGLTRLMQLFGGSLAAQAGLWQALWPDLVARAGAPYAPFTPNPRPAASEDPHRDAPQSRSTQPRSTQSGSNRPEPPRPGAAAAPSGSAPVAGASADGGHDMAQLKARLALLEERLASLETGAGTPRRGARPGARRRRAS
ncbi:hypothetical protein GCM10011611_11830 [Aliidongia dinghuensis]|uniref:Uncharacterized protein n=1 Tax=Aliidongia dinghuensis TaxID=1867774 RepID=A0A8J2YQN8_9PROT|nr:hypothetical protein GCM10011611_11830 [Aliidongia dinghuensis]